MITCWRSEDFIFASLLRYVSVGVDILDRVILKKSTRQYLAQQYSAPAGCKVKHDMAYIMMYIHRQTGMASTAKTNNVWKYDLAMPRRHYAFDESCPVTIKHRCSGIWIIRTRNTHCKILVLKIYLVHVFVEYHRMFFYQWHMSISSYNGLVQNKRQAFI